MAFDVKEARDRVENLRKAGETQRQELVTRMARAVSYFQGRHWVRRTSFTGGYNSSGFELSSNYNPDSRGLRVTNNFITSLTQLAEAATHPITVPIDVRPYQHDLNPTSRLQAHVTQFIFEREQERMRVDSCAAGANLMAAIVGSWVIGVELFRNSVEIGEANVADWFVRWCTFPSTDLLLESSRQNPNLLDHDEVGLRMIVPLNKAKRQFGIELKNPEHAKTVGDLTEDYSRAYQLSGNTLFKSYAQMSKVKAIEVFQYHRRADPGSGRFDEMYVFADLPDNNNTGLQIINEDDLESPFGGSGLPIGLWQYHLMPESPFGQGATGQMIDKQNLANLHETLFERGFATSGHPHWVIDERGCSRENWETQSRNMNVGGPIFYRGQLSNQGVAPPTPIKTPEPSAQHIQRTLDLNEQARSASHRSRLNQGIGKSHVPDVTTQRLLEEGDKVPNLIVEHNARVLGDLVRVTIGTHVRALQVGSPSLLQRLINHGFTQDDLMAVRDLDSDDFNLQVRIPRDALRPESPFGRQQRIRESVEANNPTVSPMEARYMYAADADMPLSDVDRRAIRFFEELARDVLEGRPFEPVPHVNHEMFKLVFQREMYGMRGQDKRDRINRLARALDAQMQLAEQETAARQQATQGEGPATASEPGGIDLSGLVGGASPPPLSIAG